MSEGKVIQEGLRGVVVARSAICALDGQTGKLAYRGIHIDELAEHSTYEETVYLLWFGQLPSEEQLDVFRDRLAAERSLSEATWRVLRALPENLDPMAALRTVVSVLGASDPHTEDGDPRAALDRAVRLTAKLPTIVAGFHRLRSGEEPLDPDPEMDHAGNFLAMLRGDTPAPVEQRAMDLAMLLMAEHEFNASTFTARVTASTLSDIYSAIASAIGTLKGPLHGGANQCAMEMMLEIGEVDQVEPYIDAAFAAKRRIMGFGHRVYDVIDPRSDHLEEMLRKVSRYHGDERWLEIAKAVVEAVEKRKKGLYPNVDFFAAPMLYLLGVPIDLFTSIFAMSRIAGWTAHVMEQYEENHLLRPLSCYVGEANRHYVPFAERNGRFVNQYLEEE